MHSSAAASSICYLTQVLAQVLLQRTYTSLLICTYDGHGTLLLQAVLVPGNTVPDTPIVHGYDFSHGRDLDGLMAAMLTSGFQATELGQAVEEVNRMVSAEMPDTAIFVCNLPRCYAMMLHCWECIMSNVFALRKTWVSNGSGHLMMPGAMNACRRSDGA